MKGWVMFAILLMSAFAVSFAAAQTYSASTTVAFDSKNATETVTSSSVDYWALWNTIAEYLVVVLVVIAFFMAYKLKKHTAKKVEKIKKQLEKKSKTQKRKAKKR